MPRLLFSALPADLSTSDLTNTLSRPPSGVTVPASLNHSNPSPTDVKVLLTRQGHSRRMAFVGYKSDAEASWIKDVWQGVWVDGLSGRGAGSRVSVDWAKSVEECKKSSAGSHHHQLSPQPKLKKRKGNLDPITTPTVAPAVGPDDAEFRTFISTMQPRKHKSLVTEILDASGPPLPPVPAPKSVSKTPDGPGSSNPDHSAPACPATEPVPAPPQRSPSPAPVIDDEDGLTDKEYLARRMKRTLTEPHQASSSPADTTAQEVKEWDQDPAGDDHLAGSDPQQNLPNAGLSSSPGLPTEESSILETGRLFLRNLAFSVTEKEIRGLFEPFGSISQVHILLDSARKPKGLAYITFSRSQDALEAYKQLDQRDFQGRLLHILPAVTRNSRQGETGDGGSLKGRNQVKAEKDAKRKVESMKQFNWASLYMNSDAVASSVADRLKISKSELFDPTSSTNPSVKLALAETHVIAETKQFLEQQGIDTEAFTQLKGPRSQTTILVKNIPYGTTEAVLRGMFSAHGHVGRVLVPPAGTMAVVEMADGEDARSAFRALAYKRIGNAVLYLEKAPEALWKRDACTPAQASKPATDAEPETKRVGETGEPGSTLFVKNLSFETTTETLASRFSSLPGYIFARVQTKADPKRPDARKSMGFGFVGFRTAGAAQEALRRMSRVQLDGHVLELKFAKRGNEDPTEREGGLAGESGQPRQLSSAKLIVKNLAFETSKKEVYELFSVYGTIKSVRLPKKIDRQTRGFGFVEYMTKKEAEEALAGLKHTHLLGRHLVVEVAKEGEGELEEIRKKSGAAFLKSEGERSKKRKFVGLGGGDEEGMEVLEEDD